jgi:hypothetical protein
MPNIIKSWKDFASVEEWITNTQVAESGVDSSTVSIPLQPDILYSSLVTDEQKEYPFEISKSSPNAHILSNNEPCTQSFPINDISQVRSLTLENFVDTFKKSNGVFDVWKKKMKTRIDTIKSATTTYAKTQIQKTALANLATRWSDVEFFLTIVSPHPETLNLLDSTTYNQLKEADKTDLNKLSGENFAILKQVINEFHTAFEKLIKETERYYEEKEQILRFDLFYESDRVVELLAQIPYIAFTAAEVKALNMQETGDFTNKTVAGLEAKSLGIVAPGPANNNYIGLGQHSYSARTDALNWAEKKYKPIPVNVDPRTIPERSILLTIATWGWLAERKICPYLGNIPLDCLELKKMVFASYNAGVEHIVWAVKALYDKKDRNITWLKVAAVVKAAGRLKPGKQTEMENYVTSITKRLTP